MGIDFVGGGDPPNSPHPAGGGPPPKGAEDSFGTPNTCAAGATPTGAVVLAANRFAAGSKVAEARWSRFHLTSMGDGSVLAAGGTESDV